MIEGLRADRPLLADTVQPVKVITDHMNLTHWKEPQNISRQIVRWVLELTEYNIEIHHIKGMANGWADALSRRPDYDQGTKDNRDVVVLADELFIQTTTTLTAPMTPQAEDVLEPWVDPHDLRKVNGV